jgi:hypothetical protein
MEEFFLFVLSTIFLIESFFESRLYFLMLALNHQISSNSLLAKRIQRIVRVEKQWYWLSWVFLLVLIILPVRYMLLVISVITLIETIVVHEMAQVEQKVKKWVYINWYW